MTGIVPRAGRQRPRGSERGSALVLALLITVVLSLLGLAYAVVAETENRIAVNERHQAQGLYVAESGTRLVKNWFDDPASGYLRPTPAQVNRSLRHVDPDGDGTHESYVSAPSPWNVIYRSGADDLFEKPYRGHPSLSFEGTAANPDIRISDTGSPAEAAFLATVNGSMFPNFPGPRLRTRIRQIDIYAPPILTIGGNRVRYGIATVRVAAAIVENAGTGSEIQVGERVVKAILNEAPYPGPGGPLQSGKGISANGDFNVHWGKVTAVNSGDLHSNIDQKLNSGIPWYSIDRPWQLDNGSDGTADDFNSNGTVDFTEWFGNADNSIEDPWLRFWFGGTWDGGGVDTGMPNSQPLRFGPVRPPSPPGVPVVVDTEHSNVFLHVDRELFPNVDYDLWKGVALSGGRNIHYFTYDAATQKFREGNGPLLTVEEATNGQVGLFFFDTVDRLKPHDDDGDGWFDNLTPPVTIQGSNWWSGGFIFLNAELIKSTGLGNVPNRPMEAPGEPFIDTDADGTVDPDEYFLNLNYPGGTYVSATFGKTHWTTPATAPAGVVRNAAGPVLNERIHMYGVLYTNGQWEAKGNAVYYGSVLAKQGVSEATGGAAGTPDIYFDERLIKGSWPPPMLKLPRTIVTVWETEK